MADKNFDEMTKQELKEALAKLPQMSREEQAKAIATGMVRSVVRARLVRS